MISISEYILLIQFVNFLIGLAIINFLIIKPIRSILAKRRAMNDALRAEAASRNASAAAKLDTYEARLARTRAAMVVEREQAKVEGAKAATVRLEEASASARDIRKQASDRLSAESAEARQDLSARLPDFTRQALNRMLGIS